jgi:hypothetical protein
MWNICTLCRRSSAYLPELLGGNGSAGVLEGDTFAGILNENVFALNCGFFVSLCTSVLKVLVEVSDGLPLSNLQVIK